MLIHSKYRPSPSFQSLCVGDESVAASQSARSLGVIFDEHMSFHAHVSSICRSSFYHLRNLSRIRKYFTIKICYIYRALFKNQNARNPKIFFLPAVKKKTHLSARVMARTVQLLRHDAYCPIKLSN